jgi:DNA-directed RNA polymerase subunit RPC12/RpoP
MQRHDRPSQDVRDTPPRACGDCGRDMVLAALLPRLGILPALRNYRCPTCGNVELDVLDHLDGDAKPDRRCRVVRI